MKVFSYFIICMISFNLEAQTFESYQKKVENLKTRPSPEELLKIFNIKSRPIEVTAGSSPEKINTNSHFPRKIYSETSPRNSFAWEAKRGQDFAALEPFYRAHILNDLPVDTFLAMAPTHLLGGNDEIRHIDGPDQAQALLRDKLQGLYTFANLELGTSPQMKQAQSSKCFACHQAQGPIFPRFPWDGAGGVGSANFDAQVRAANRWMQSKRLCKEVCNTPECRKNLLALSFIFPRVSFRPLSFYSEELSRLKEFVAKRQLTVGRAVDDIKFLNQKVKDYDFYHTLWNEGLKKLKEQVIKNYPKHLYAYPSSVLPNKERIHIDFKTGKESALYSFLEVDRPESFDQLIKGGFNGENIDPTHFYRNYPMSEEQKKIYYLTYQDNFAGSNNGRAFNLVTKKDTDGIVSQGLPTYPRPYINKVFLDDLPLRLATQAHHCFDFELIDLMEFYEEPWKKVEGILESADTKALLEVGYPEARDLNTKMNKTELSKKMALAKLRAAVVKAPESVQKEDNTKKFLANKERALNLIKTSCSDCHLNTKPKLPLSDPKALRDYSVIESIENKSMPPMGYKHSLSDLDRAFLLEFLKTLP